MNPHRRQLAMAALLVLLFTYLPFGGHAEHNPDITKACRFRFSGDNPRDNPAFDRKYKTGLRRYRERVHTVVITLPKGVTQGGLYLCFSLEPARLAVFHEGADEPFYVDEGETFAHRYVPFEGGGTLRVEMTGTKEGVTLSELFVFEGAAPPDWVQRWQPPLEKADMLLVVAHPDDELLWFGGAIPYYTYERGLDVAVATMTCANPLRRSEMLNGLWTAGIRHYPRLGTFRDKRRSGIKQSYEVWGGQQKVEDHLTALIREVKPEVLLTHDLKGEYGHPAHIITARAVLAAVAAAPERAMHLDSVKQFGTWDVPKTYLHLYPENTLEMDWQQPIAARGGITALEVCVLAFREHRSQHERFSVDATGPYSCTRFGLYRSLVGDDINKDDFFENIK